MNIIAGRDQYDIRTKILDKPWQATEVKSIETIPDEPKVLDEAQVRRVFKDALAAQPQC